jgi:FkbM family methyltransferase
MQKTAARKRKEFLAQARSMTPLVAAEYEGSIFVFPPSLGEKFFVNSDRKDLRILGQAVATLRDTGSLGGTTFVDVGAHIGTTTVSALAHQGFERAVAIEPDPDNLRLLRANLALNRLGDSVTVVPAAISDTPGSAYFLQGDPATSPAFWTKGRLTAEPTAGALPIDVVTLDALAADGVVDPSSTGLLWLDCQKREQEALRAASRFLEARVPLVFALRHRDVAENGPALAALGDVYGRFVDLRRNELTERGEPWSPVAESLGELLERRSQKKGLTDVLVY